MRGKALTYSTHCYLHPLPWLQLLLTLSRKRVCAACFAVVHPGMLLPGAQQYETTCRMSRVMHALHHVLACAFLVEGLVKQELGYWL